MVIISRHVREQGKIIYGNFLPVTCLMATGKGPFGECNSPFQTSPKSPFPIEPSLVKNSTLSAAIESALATL